MKDEFYEVKKIVLTEGFEAIFYLSKLVKDKFKIEIIKVYDKSIYKKFIFKSPLSYKILSNSDVIDYNDYIRDCKIYKNFETLKTKVIYSFDINNSEYYVDICINSSDYAPDEYYCNMYSRSNNDNIIYFVSLNNFNDCKYVFDKCLRGNLADTLKWFKDNNYDVNWM